MARQNEGPWYRQSKGTWYATLSGGRKVSLGIRGEASKAEAFTAWHRLMADAPAQAEQQTPTQANVKPSPVKAEPVSKFTVKALADAFTADAPTRLKPKTVRLYRDEGNRLCQSLGSIPADELTTQQLSLWLAKLPLSSTSKSISIRAVSAMLAWALKAKLITTNPAKEVPKPKSRSRSQASVISEADHAKLMASASPEFKLVLRILHSTGCRPGEACKITAETFRAEAGCVILHDHKTAHATDKPRLVFLPPELCEELKAQAQRFGSGPLLRSHRGIRWTPQAISQAMRRLQYATGLRSIAYGYRHAFATQALSNGIPDATVAALLGHSSTAMLHKHYSHLTSNATAMREALAKVHRQV